uniref:LigA n=1 Tax=Parastrongyloides trichosuri TaxID=131310 RepID=A0A0N4Z2V4_PARTI
MAPSEPAAAGLRHGPDGRRAAGRGGPAGLELRRGGGGDGPVPAAAHRRPARGDGAGERRPHGLGPKHRQEITDDRDHFPQPEMRHLAQYAGSAARAGRRADGGRVSEDRLGRRDPEPSGARDGRRAEGPAAQEGGEGRRASGR